MKITNLMTGVATSGAFACPEIRAAKAADKRWSTDAVMTANQTAALGTPNAAEGGQSAWGPPIG